MNEENKPERDPEENNPEERSPEETGSDEHTEGDEKGSLRRGRNLSEEDNPRPDNTAPEEEQKEEEQKEEEITFQRLYRSRKSKIILGVCGGLGKYFNIDPVIFRLLFILSLLLGGWGLLIYFIAAITIPYDPNEEAVFGIEGQSEEQEAGNSRENTKIVIGSSLILLGLFALLKSTGLIKYFTFFGLTNEIIMPVVLIALGIFLIYRHNFSSRNAAEDKERSGSRPLYLSVHNRKISGVCGGLGEYFGIDPNLIRMLWLIFTFSSFGIGILIYVLFAVIVPKEENGVNLE